ncbi:phosphoribosylanthranilate isomerase [Acidithiobacillus sp.]
MVRIKICGITTIDDALAAAEAGTDAIGLVFYPPSPRAVAVEVAAAIMAALPPFVTSVGLFVNAQRSWVEAVLQSCPLDLLQFHGDEAAADCSGFGRPYIKVVRVTGEEDLRPQLRAHPSARGFLLDRAAPQLWGGSGETFSWWPLPKLDKPLILAGGLSPDNVAEAIAITRPYAVDVSSGVEASPGRKDHGKMRDFVARARAADRRAEG